MVRDNQTIVNGNGWANSIENIDDFHVWFIFIFGLGRLLRFECRMFILATKCDKIDNIRLL